MKKKVLIGILAVGLWHIGTAGSLWAQANGGSQAAPAAAQKDSQISDSDIQLLRQNLRAQKKQLVAANLTLTTDQATKFWPVYDQYIAEQTKIHDQKYAVIKEFATSFGTIDDVKALDLTNKALAVDQQVTQLRIKYVPIFSKVLPGKQVATFYQIDRRLQMMVDLQLLSQLPLVQTQ
jgi:Spy/CpxP family protein refolding chaperone